MAWIYLFLAGVFEISWPAGFKLAQLNPNYRVLFILFAAIGMGISGYFLYIAQKSIPIGVSYAIWTGVGAIGTFLLGVCYFNDNATLISWFGIACIVLGISMLKMSAH